MLKLALELEVREIRGIIGLSECSILIVRLLCFGLALQGRSTTHPVQLHVLVEQMQRHRHLGQVLKERGRPVYRNLSVQVRGE